jgi:hypothetical protein
MREKTAIIKKKGIHSLKKKSWLISLQITFYDYTMQRLDFFFQYGLIFITYAYMGLQHAGTTMKPYNGERVMTVNFFIA